MEVYCIMTASDVAKMSLYLHELTNQRVGVLSEFKPGPDKFSVILHNKAKVIEKFSENSAVHAGKPVMWFSSIFGCQYFVYNNNNTIKPFSILSLVYAAVVAILFLGINGARFSTYNILGIDIPLIVLTILVAVIKLVLVFQQFSMTALCRPYYVNLFQVINDLDQHFSLTRGYYRRLRWLSIALIIFPLLLIFIQCAHYMRQNKAGEFNYFAPQYLTTPVTLVIVAAHTAGTFYIIINLYRRLIMLNILIESKAKLPILSKSKQGDCFKLKSSFGTRKWSRFAIFSNLENDQHGHYCWLELMQMYDKIADCFFLINKIYASQVFVLLLQLLVFILTIICRNMSPYFKKRSLFLRDIYELFLWFVRPLTLGIISDLTEKQRSKSIAMLHLVMLHGNLDQQYFSQVNMMLNLVKNRPLAISAGVTDLSVRMILQSAAKIISYVILFIQYFYLNKT